MASVQIVPLPTAHVVSDDYVVARARLEDLLLRHTLLASYDSFADERKPYPFASLDALLPGTVAPAAEHALQNTALVFLLDRTLPDELNKHFRLRGSNRATWANIRRLAPDLDLSDYKTVQCQVADPGFEELLPKLLPLDYALIVERPRADPAEPCCELTHVHVKVERLTDNAIKQLGRKLGYVERRLFERGEDYVDALEAKFYEYHGFPPNASGRKSAAAMAAQLFAEQGLRFTVFAASQEDCRLCVLDESDRIIQYMLVQPDASLCTALERQAGGDLGRFIARQDGGHPVFVLRAVFHRTAAAMPVRPGEKRADGDLQVDWLAIDELAVVTPTIGALHREAIGWD